MRGLRRRAGSGSFVWTGFVMHKNARTRPYADNVLSLNPFFPSSPVQAVYLHTHHNNNIRTGLQRPYGLAAELRSQYPLKERLRYFRSPSLAHSLSLCFSLSFSTSRPHQGRLTALRVWCVRLTTFRRRNYARHNCSAAEPTSETFSLSFHPAHNNIPHYNIDTSQYNKASRRNTQCDRLFIIITESDEDL